MNTCDLNVSMEPADEFMREIFGVTGAFDPPDVDDEKDQDIEDIHPGDHENVGGTAPYPNMTNQDMINAFSKAFSRNFWIAVIRAGLDYMGVDSERNKEYVGPAIEDLPDLTKSEKTSVKKRLISAGFLNTNGTEEEKEDKTAPPLDGPGFWVKVKEKKTDCQNFKSGKTGKDLKGKPIMKNVDPPIILKKGNTVRVSSTHWVSDKDKKDGVVFAQRRLEHYYILESPDNPKAVRNYIRKSDTRKIRS
jgi:hypothetical protein